MSDLLRLSSEKFPYNTAVGYDHKAWAKRILFREGMGDKDLSALQVKFAREALGITV